MHQPIWSRTTLPSPCFKEPILKYLRKWENLSNDAHIHSLMTCHFEDHNSSSHWSGKDRDHVTRRCLPGLLSLYENLIRVAPCKRLKKKLCIMTYISTVKLDLIRHQKINAWIDFCKIILHMYICVVIQYFIIKKVSAYSVWYHFLGYCVSPILSPRNISWRSYPVLSKR